MVNILFAYMMFVLLVELSQLYSLASGVLIISDYHSWIIIPHNKVLVSKIILNLLVLISRMIYLFSSKKVNQVHYLKKKIF